MEISEISIEQRFEKIMRRLERSSPDYAQNRLEREVGSIDGIHLEENIETLEQILERIDEDDFLKSLSRYYLVKTNPISRFQEDFPRIMDRIDQLTDRKKKFLLNVLLELATACFEEEEGKLNSESRFKKHGEWFKRFKKAIHSIKNAFPLDQITKPWKAVRSLGRYKSVTQMILNLLTEGMNTRKAQALRNRVKNLQLDVKYPWEQERIARTSGQLRFVATKRLLLEVARRVIAVGLSVVATLVLINFRKEIFNIASQVLVFAFQLGGTSILSVFLLLFMCFAAKDLFLNGSKWIMDKIGLDGWITLEVLEWINLLLVGLTIKMMWENPIHIVRIGKQVFGIALKILGIFFLLLEYDVFKQIQNRKREYNTSPQTKRINRWIESVTAPLASFFSGYQPQEG